MLIERLTARSVEAVRALAGVEAWPAAFNGASALLLVGLGVAVAWLRPRTRATAAFAVFAVLFGLHLVVENAGALFGAPPAPIAVAAAAAPLAGVAALIALVAAFPVPLGGRELRGFLLSAGGAVGTAAAVAAWVAVGRGASALEVLHSTSTATILAAQWVFLFVLASRFEHEPDAAIRRQHALFTLGLMLYPQWAAGSMFAAHPAAAFTLFAVAFVFAARWLVIAARGPQPRTARNMAWVALLAVLVGMLTTAWAARGSVAALATPGVVRLAGVAILAYAVARAGLFGLDLKVRWTIRQSTLAGAFVAVFFVVSEAAATFLQESTQSTYLGIVAAGALLFALAPLQRLAERVASAAVPGAGVVGGAAGEKAEAFRAAVALALADGAVTREEEVHLAKLAAALGLTHEDAVALRHTVEDEQASVLRS